MIVWFGAVWSEALVTLSTCPYRVCTGGLAYFGLVGLVRFGLVRFGLVRLTFDSLLGRVPSRFHVEECVQLRQVRTRETKGKKGGMRENNEGESNGERGVVDVTFATDRAQSSG